MTFSEKLSTSFRSVIFSSSVCCFGDFCICIIVHVACWSHISRNSFWHVNWIQEEKSVFIIYILGTENQHNSIKLCYSLLAY